MTKVLVVDDEEDILELVTIRLKRAGYRVVAARSADEALRVVEDRGPPDVAVLDVTMPGMDGLELLRALRSRPGLEELPAVFLSARVQPDDVDAGRALGATYLTKPFVASALLSAVAAVVNSAERTGADGW